MAIVESHEKRLAKENTELLEEENRLKNLLNAEVCHGTLSVHCDRAEIYIDTEMFGKMDPFVVFE